MSEATEGSTTTPPEAPRRQTEIVIRLPNLQAWLEDRLPSEFFDHMRTARHEQLLAVRSLIDAAIARTEKQQRTRQRVDITVD